MYLRILLLLLAVLFIAGCGNREIASEPFEYIPVVLIIFSDLDPAPALPWDIPGENLSKVVLASSFDETEIDVVDMLLSSAVNDNLLLCLVDCDKLPDSLSREHIVITTGNSNTVLSSPPEVLDDMNTGTWLQPAGRNTVLRDIMDKYRPDLLISVERQLDIEGINEIASVWFDSELTHDISVVFYSPPAGSYGRGWAVFHGPTINGSIAKGLAPCNLLATIKLLAGLPWTDSIPEMIPAVGILNTPENIFENGSNHD